MNPSNNFNINPSNNSIFPLTTNLEAINTTQIEPQFVQVHFQPNLSYLDLVQQIQQLQTSNRRLHSDNQRLQRLLGEEKQRHGATLERHNTLAKDYEVLIQQSRDLQDIVTSLQTENQRLKEDNERLTKRVSELEDKEKVLEGRVTQLEADKKNLDTRVIQLEADRKAQEQSLTARQVAYAFRSKCVKYVVGGSSPDEKTLNSQIYKEHGDAAFRVTFDRLEKYAKRKGGDFLTRFNEIHNKVASMSWFAPSIDNICRGLASSAFSIAHPSGAFDEVGLRDFVCSDPNVSTVEEKADRQNLVACLHFISQKHGSLHDLLLS